MNAADKAAAYHDKGFNCAQSVFAALGDYTHMDEKQALAVATGFGGGVKCGEICGAISGAVMALGAVFPHLNENDPGGKERTGKLAAGCVGECRKRLGALTCRELIAREGRKSCERWIRECVEVAESIILENKETD